MAKLKQFALDSVINYFNFPYFSRDIAEFCRRWNISLSAWFRDNLYVQKLEKTYRFLIKKDGFAEKNQSLSCLQKNSKIVFIRVCISNNFTSDFFNIPCHKDL